MFFETAKENLKKFFIKKYLLNLRDVGAFWHIIFRINSKRMEKEKNSGIEKYAHLYGNSFAWEMVGIYVRTLHRLFYKKIVVEGAENIPADCPLIFAPNHQNALMDPLAVLFTAHKQVVFLARADIFNNKILAKIFYFLKILPVFRMRDGRENLQNNDETFDVAVRVLENRQSVGLFPETRHNNKRSLLPLKKGVPRLVFMAEEKNDFRLGVKIVPVGINYSDYTKMRGTLFVKYGKAISAADYKDEYLENPQKAMVSLRDELESRIKPLMIDIADNEMYDTADSIRQLCSDSESNCAKKFQMQKAAIATFERLQTENPDKAQMLKEKVTEYENLKHKYGMTDRSFGFSKPLWLNALVNSLLLMVALPVFLYGFLNNAIACLALRFILPKIKDRQFHSSVKLVWAVAVMPVIYLLQTAIVAVIFPHLILFYALSLPVSGYLAKIITAWAGTTLEKWQVLRHRGIFTKKYLSLRLEILNLNKAF